MLSVTVGHLSPSKELQQDHICARKLKVKPAVLGLMTWQCMSQLCYCNTQFQKFTGFQQHCLLLAHVIQGCFLGCMAVHGGPGGSFKDQHLFGHAIPMAEGRRKMPHQTTTLNLKLLLRCGKCHVCSLSIGQSKSHGQSGWWGQRCILCTRMHCRSCDKRGGECSLLGGGDGGRCAYNPAEVGSLPCLLAHVSGRLH